MPATTTVAALTVAGAAGLVTTGAAGATESWVIVGTSAGVDVLAAASVAVTTKLFAVLAVSGVLMEKLVPPPVSCWVPTTVSPASMAPLLFTSM